MRSNDINIFSYSHRYQVLLPLLQAQSHVFYTGEHCGNWHSSPADATRCVFHLVMTGQCRLHEPDQPEVVLRDGHVVLYLQPRWHQLRGHAGQNAHMVCGYVDFKWPLSRYVLQQLPSRVICSAEQEPALRHLLPLIQLEQPMVDTYMLQQLCDVLLSYILRHELRQPVDALSYGLLSLAQDATYGVILDAVWEQPEHTWHGEQLARLVHSSKASFYRRFKRLTGLSPTQFVTMVRLFWAKQYLAEELSIEAVAEKVGYSSASALSHAFRREFGINPAQWRLQSQKGGSEKEV